jgi:hypothetical protein
MLASLTGEYYDERTNPKYLSKQIVDFVLVKLEYLKNRDWVIEQLLNDEV